MLLRLELTRDARAPAQARRAVDCLPVNLSRETADDARLLMSELVANSVQHGSGDKVTVVVDTDLPDMLRCEVMDAGTGSVPRGRGERMAGGWGLRLVERIAARSGVQEAPTRVWFTLPLGRTAPAF